VPTSEPVTITFACADVDEAYYQQKIAEFNEQYPDITVELRPYEIEAEGDVTADDADVLMAWEDILSALYTQGDLFDLQAMIETEQSLDLEDFYPGALALFSGQGTTWAIPAGLDVDVMYYNQDLFDQYGVAYPENGWTPDDFLNTAIALRDPAAGVYGYSTLGSTAEPDYGDALFFANQRGGYIFDDPREPTRTTFDAPPVIEALDWYARLYLEYDVAPTPEEARHLFQGWPSQYAFYRGVYLNKVAMWALPFSERGGTYWEGNQWLMHWGTVAMPQGAQSATFPWGDGYAISAQSPHPEACWRWIVFLSQEIPYQLIPARKSLLESAEYEELAGGDLAAVARASIERADLTRANPGTLARFNDVDTGGLWGEAVNSVVSGESTPQEALDLAQREAETQMGQ
jgi:multiple sugar transport system substrate-binding protein